MARARSGCGECMDETTLRLELARAAEAFDLSPNSDRLKVVSRLFDAYPENVDLSTVWWKVAVLDSLYDTNLRFSVGTEGVAKWIVANRRTFGKSVSEGEIDAERMLEAGPSSVSNLVGDRLYSFATKYCHFSNPAAYPIYDSRSYESLRAFHRVKPLPFDPFKLDGSRWYEEWSKDIQEVMAFLSTPDYREADKPLYQWNGGRQTPRFGGFRFSLPELRT